MMNFDEFVTNGIISQATRDWLEPLWEKEQQDIILAREAASQNLFCNANDDDGVDDIVEEASITIGDVTIHYFRDDNSTGHGNRVWHASIATCLLLSKLDTSLRVLELGAGTALPSLYSANVLARCEFEHKPLLHITDGRQYRNIRQILASVNKQASKVRKRVNFRISPHNWGEGVGNRVNSMSFFGTESPSDSPNEYDVVIVSDCIYNPVYHAPLLESIAATLKFEGGRALVSFSLHGNTSDETVWNFLSMANEKLSADRSRRLLAAPISELPGFDDNVVTASVGKGGWDMEEMMRHLGIWLANVEQKRWVAYLYELRWVDAEKE